MKKLLILIFLTLFFINPAFGEGLTLFTTQIAAQEHCKNDEVVWLNLPTGVWHTRGALWYGRTKHGAYVCRLEAATQGDRGSLNGS